MVELLKKHTGIFLFTFSIMFFSGMGQSFLLGQYFFHIKKDLNITGTEISFAYSLATLLACFNLSTIGTFIDRYSWTKSTLITISFIFLGQIILSFSKSVVFLFVGFYFLRCFGQMTLSSISGTLIGKIFGDNRGKFNTLASYGRSVAEGVLPSLIAFFISIYFWRFSLVISGLLLMGVMIPLTLFLGRKVGKSPLYGDKNAISLNSSKENMKWKELFFEEKKALIIMLGNMVLPFILTGIFIQQSDLAISRGWEIKEAAIGFIFFSCFQIVGNTIFGHLVDKFGAFRLIHFTPISLFVGLFFLKIGSAVGVFYIAMGVLGFTVGIHTSIINAFWAEVYGVNYLGRIKGMDSTMIVLGTSIAPIFFSYVLDKGYNFNFLISFCLFLTVASLLLFTLGKRGFSKCLIENNQ